VAFLRNRKIIMALIQITQIEKQSICAKKTSGPKHFWSSRLCSCWAKAQSVVILRGCRGSDSPTPPHPLHNPTSPNPPSQHLSPKLPNRPTPTPAAAADRATRSQKAQPFLHSTCAARRIDCFLGRQRTQLVPKSVPYPFASSRRNSSQIHSAASPIRLLHLGGNLHRSIPPHHRSACSISPELFTDTSRCWSRSCFRPHLNRGTSLCSARGISGTSARCKCLLVSFMLVVRGAVRFEFLQD
jgi:hypothetical protein